MERSWAFGEQSVREPCTLFDLKLILLLQS
jgi:hypothetical protein